MRPRRQVGGWTRTQYRVDVGSRRVKFLVCIRTTIRITITRGGLAVFLRCSLFASLKPQRILLRKILALKLFVSSNGGLAAACVRCGKAFWGDWDRHATSHGVLCHVCTNRAHAGHDGVATEQAERLADSTAPSRQRPAPTEVPKRRFLENEKTRGLVILGGFAAVTITLWLIFPVEKYIAKFFASSPTEMPEDTPQSLDIVMLIVGFLLGTLNFLVRIYVGLAMCDKLLNEEFHLNLIQVGGIAAVFCGIGFAAIHPFGFIYVIIFRVWLI